VYTVVLALTLNGASIGSTNDVFEAASAVEAEVQAIAAWRAAEPSLTFHPLLVIERH
jgi:hypothetical protein